MATGTKKKSTKKRKPRRQSNTRIKTVKRAADLKKLTKPGGRKRATAKRRLEKAGARGDEWR